MTLISSTWKHIRRSPYQAIAAVLTMFLTLLLAGTFFLATTASYYVLKFFESKPQITVFFSDKASDQEASALQKTLEATGKTAGVKYVSKDQALAIYREQNKNDPLLLEMVTADILPASLEVSATNPTYLKDLEPVIRSAQGVDEVVFQKDVVDTLISWTRAIRVGGGALAFFLAFDSILIVMTVIGMKIALKKKEVEILTLVGASPWYIRAPFILEGGFYGAAAAFVAWIILMALIVWMRPMMLGFLGNIPAIQTVLADPFSSMFLLSAALFWTLLTMSGFALGSIGSLIAVGRYLRIS